MKPMQFKCAACGGIFTKGWTDDEASDELHTKFPDEVLSDAAVVCDDCFQVMAASEQDVINGSVHDHEDVKREVL